MDVQSVKIDLIHWLKELEDKSVLEQLQDLREKHTSSLKINKEQEKELDKRLAKYENGKMKFSPWYTVKMKIRNRAKDAL